MIAEATSVKMSYFYSEVIMAKRHYFIVIILFLILPCHLRSLPFGIETKLIESAEALTKNEPQAPNPAALNPQWWKYFEVEPKELPQRIQSTSFALNNSYLSLPLSEQEQALSKITTIIANLNSFLALQTQTTKDQTIEKAFQKSYTLEQQLDLNHKIRKLTLEIKNLEEEYEQQRAKINKGDKFVDNLMVAYLAKPPLSPERLSIGLEIMQRRTSLAVLCENTRLLKSRIEQSKKALLHKQKELDASIDLLDLHEFDETQLDRLIKQAQNEYEEAKAAFNTAELNSLETFNDTPLERAMRHLSEQKVIYANVYQTLAWAKLSFQMLKFNVIMDMNERFEGDKTELREQLENWKEKVRQYTMQIKDWNSAANRDQDRVRQDYALMVAQSDTPDPKLNRVNQLRRQESSNTLNALQLLEEKLLDVQWMVNLLDRDIKNSSGIVSRGISEFFGLIYYGLLTLSLWANFSLFKISGIPITLFMLFKVCVILVATSFASKFIQTAVLPLIKKRGHLSDSSLYYVGRLMHFCALILGTVTALVSVGLDFGNLFLLASALVFGIGFGFQSVANNIFCGFRILFERKIKIGDYVELSSGKNGKVTEIQLQHTVITTSDGREIIVPNSELIDRTVINWTLSNDYRRLHIPFSTATTVDKDLVRKLVSESAYKVAYTLKNHPKHANPQVWLVGFGDNSLDFELVVWVNMHIKGATESREGDYLWEIETVLRENNIALPVQEQKLYLQYLRQVKPALEDKSHQPLQLPY